MSLGEIIRLERAILSIENHLGMALEQQRQGTSGGADIDCLPKAIQN